MNGKDSLARLEEWKGSYKGHAVTIDHPNGFGAGCWNLTLEGPQRLGRANIHVHGAAFYEYDEAQLPDNVVFVTVTYVDDDGEEDYRFGTLEECIDAGLDRHELLLRRLEAGEKLNLWIKDD